jgi:GDPmannose 4,6-dehydratase
MNKKKALILGINGQDGSYLARFLIGKGYLVHGITRDARGAIGSNLKTLGVNQQVAIHGFSPLDKKRLADVICEFLPDEIYNLAGPSSVGLCERDPRKTKDDIVGLAQNIISAVSGKKGQQFKIFNAASGDCFGSLQNPADEASSFNPVSAYGRAKTAVVELFRKERSSSNLFCSSGILFNHESPFRSSRFVVGKVVQHVRRLNQKEVGKIELGDLDIIRDWGWAAEYVEAMWLSLQEEEPTDFVIARGDSARLVDFVAELYKTSGKDWRDYVVEGGYVRQNDISASYANPLKARNTLGWSAKVDLPEIAKRCVYGCDGGL